MSGDAELPAFDELPFVYQARIHDIQLELKDGEITQKGFDKRLAKIMGEYQASTHIQRTPASIASSHAQQSNLGSENNTYNLLGDKSSDTNSHIEPTSEQATPISNSDSTSLQQTGSNQPARTPGPGSRNGSKRAFYDARKSTVSGFRKPGINFEALLDDFGAGHSEDDDTDNANAHPLPKISISDIKSGSAASPLPSDSAKFSFGLGSPLQNAPPVPRLPSTGRAPYNAIPGPEPEDDTRFDVDMSSGRAYNVLSDIMDPYGAQSSRANQDLYSDDSSSNSILDDLDALGPTEFNPNITPNGALHRNREPSDPNPAPNDSAAIDASTSVSQEHFNSRFNNMQRKNAANNDLSQDSASTDSHRVEQQVLNIQSANIPSDSVQGSTFAAGPSPPNVSMLTPETPSSKMFANTRFTEGKGVLNGAKQIPTQTDRPIFSETSASSGLSPVCDIRHGMDDFGDALPVREEHHNLARQYSTNSAITDNARTSTSGGGTITLDDMAQASHMVDTKDEQASFSGAHSRPVLLSGSGHGLDAFSSVSDSTNAAMATEFSYADRLANDFEEGIDISNSIPEHLHDKNVPLHSSITAGFAGSRSKEHDNIQSTSISDPQTAQHSLSTQPYRVSQADSERYLRMIDDSYIADDGNYKENVLSRQGDQFTMATGNNNSPGDDFDHTSVLDAIEYLHPQHEEAQQKTSSQIQPRQSLANRPKRRLTHGARIGRRPTNAATTGIGRASYYAEESELEIPINFDIPDSPLPMTDSIPATPRAGPRELASGSSSPPASTAITSVLGLLILHKANLHMLLATGSSMTVHIIVTMLQALHPFGIQPAQSGFEQSGVPSSTADIKTSMTAPLEREPSGTPSGLVSTSNSAPVRDDFIYHSTQLETTTYEYSSANELADNTSIGMQHTHVGHAQTTPEQLPLSLSSTGAIVYPRDIPEDVYSSKLKHLMETHGSLPSVLRHRASATPNEIAYTCIDTKGKEIGSWTWSGLHTRAIQIVQLLRQKGVSMWGDRVALIYRKYEMLDFVGSLFGCFYAGVCAVPIVAGDSYAELVHVLNSTSSVLVLTSDLNIKALHKDLSHNTVGPGWPTNVSWVRTDNLGGTVLSPVGTHSPSNQYHARQVPDIVYNSQTDVKIDNISLDDLAYIEFSKSPNGELKGVQITHGAIMRQCANWMMSTGMLDIGRKYKHRVELEEEEEEEYSQDYSFGLADTANEIETGSTPSTPASHLEMPTLPQSESHGNTATISSPTNIEQEKHTSRGSFGKKWGGSTGFLGRLRNAGSLPKIRRGSRGRESAIVDSSAGNKLSHSSTRNSLTSSFLGDSGNRMRATSNLSTVSQQSQKQPLYPPYSQQHQGDSSSFLLAGGPSQQHGRTRLSVMAKPTVDVSNDFGGERLPAKTPNANVAVFKDVVVFYIEPRQHFGLVYGILGGCYGGHQSIYSSSALCDTPGAYINLLTRYRATVAVGDYTGLQSVLSVATDDPREIIDFSKKTQPNLARLRLCLIDTLFIDPVFHATFNRNVLHPFGCPYQSISDTEGHSVVTPVCTLAEHGSALMAMRDCLPGHPPINVDNDPTLGYEFVLDREAFRQNRVVVLPGEKNEAEVDEIGTVRYHSFGFPALDSTIAVVDPETRELCAADSIGELWIDSPSLGTGFWGLPKLSNRLMGAIVQGRVLVFGFYEDRIRTLTVDPTLDARIGTPAWYFEPTLGFHYAGDINSTIRRYLPQISECTAFEMFANDTHFPVIAAEVRHNSGMYATIAEEIYGVLRNRHGLYAYAVVLCPPNTLPRAFQYGKRTVNAQLCRHQFESGKVNCHYARISTDHLFMNLPPPAAMLPEDDVGGAEDPSIALYGRWLQQTSLEEGLPSIDEVTGMDLSSFSSITEILVWRASKFPEQVAYNQFDGRARPLKPMTFQKLLTKASGVAQMLLDKKRVVAGDYVLVAITPSPSFVVAIHACLAIGAIPIPISPPDLERLADDLPPLLVTARELKVNYILVDQQSEEIFKSKMMEAAMRVQSLRSLLGAHRMPGTLAIAKASKSPKTLLGRGNFRFNPQWADPARTSLLMVFTGAQASTPQYVSYSHKSILGFCSQQKGDFQMLPNVPVIASVRAYNGYGLLHCAIIGVYVGCTTLLLSPTDFFAAPNVWFELVQRYKVKDAFTTLPMLQHAMNFLSAYVGQYNFRLNSVRNFIVATEERVDPLTYMNIRDFFAQYYLDEMSINPLYGTLMNPCISTRAYLGVNPLVLRLDVHAMRRGRIVAMPHPEVGAVEETEIHTLTLQDSGKVSGSTMAAIVDPATRLALPAGSIGEVWVCSTSNASRKQTLAPSVASGVFGNSVGGRMLMAVSSSTGHLDGDPENEFVRTGDLGFLYLQVSQGGEDGAPAEPYLFVAGKISETFTIDGYMYFYSDIERAVEEASEDIALGNCVVIQTTLQESPKNAEGNNAKATAAVESSALRLVAVISLRQQPSEAFLPNSACLVFNNVLDQHQVLLDEIVFISRDSMPRSRISERRRRTVRGLYESGRLNAYVSYPISNPTMLPSGLANPNNRHSMLGLPSVGNSLSLAQ
ncbi:hypothetical protein BX070DRAFT_251469 [Coemansia spiralis]|nr:hypothetical protein BX070DRAFT_251469 [Coemansia spiralis]